jgi:NADH-ubiquinone oxidoreductase chain 4
MAQQILQNLGNLGYLFGCDVISYVLVLLSLWICALTVLARESLFLSGPFSGLFLFFVFLAVVLYCTFRKISLLSFYVFFDLIQFVN